MVKKDPLKIGSYEIFWLDGGVFQLDGGGVFGVVPRVLWEKKYPPFTGNNVLMEASPILLKGEDKNILIDTGLGNKLTEKQKKIYGILQPWDIHQSLEQIGLNAEKIDYVILTHCDYDHVGGLVQYDKNGELEPTFPNAKIFLQRKEWEDVKNPNKRAAHSFWEINFKGVEESGNLELIDGNSELLKGVFVEYTGGHNRGHQIVKIISGNEVAFHLGDILPSHAHFNPLWVAAYDSYPLDVIELKEKYLSEIVEKQCWVLFYHDPHIMACKFNEKGDTLFSKERERRN
ncbi:MAG: MBL fold metallo-hydrolase [Acidobacteriota bacterium]